MLTPSVHPGIRLDLLPIIGKIISHAYLICGILPVRIAFLCLAAMLLEDCHGIPDNILVDTFVDSFCVHNFEVPTSHAGTDKWL